MSMETVQLDRKLFVIITCEHGGNEVPKEYRQLFVDAKEALKSQRGIDVGALELAQSLADRLSAPLFSSVTTRLLIDLNRSLDQPALYSKWSANLSSTDRKKVIEKFYKPYRDSIEQITRQQSEEFLVLQISIHSFVPVYDGTPRKTDVGILFDPERPSEKHISHLWKQNLQSLLPNKSIHLNLPFHGARDGFKSYLRTQFTTDQYAGIELEVNQKHLIDAEKRESLIEKLLSSTESLIDHLNQL